jgi:hydrogenase expression/formation protein HypC
MDQQDLLCHCIFATSNAGSERVSAEATMCLGVPGQIISIDEKNAVVDFWGSHRKVHLDILEESVSPGDYIIEHAGYAIRRIPDADVADTLGTYEVILTEAGEDPCALDVIAELETADTDKVLV